MNSQRTAGHSLPVSCVAIARDDLRLLHFQSGGHNINGALVSLDLSSLNVSFMAGVQVNCTLFFRGSYSCFIVVENEFAIIGWFIFA